MRPWNAKRVDRRISVVPPDVNSLVAFCVHCSESVNCGPPEAFMLRSPRRSRFEPGIWVMPRVIGPAKVWVRVQYDYTRDPLRFRSPPTVVVSAIAGEAVSAKAATAVAPMTTRALRRARDRFMVFLTRMNAKG